MHVSLLRPLLFAILGAFVAAAPAAPVPGRAKKERKGPSGTCQARGHDQKLEEPERHVPAEASVYGFRVCVATGGERAPTPTGDVARAGDHVSFPYPRAQAVSTAHAAPARDLAAPRPADLRAGLLTLPPPARRCT